MDKEYAKYLLEKTRKDYNQIAEGFSRAREKPWPEMRFLFDDYLKDGERVLDLGCGNGRFYEAIGNKKVEYVGTDNSEKLIAIAKEKYPEAQFKLTGALELPFPDNFFDKVYSIAVLQHIPSKEFRLKLLKEAKRTLKPGGLLILTVWNLWRKTHIEAIIKNALLKILGKSKLDFKDFFLHLNKRSFFKGFYYHCFSKKELERLIKAADFELKQSGIITMSVGKKPQSNFYIIAKK